MLLRKRKALFFAAALSVIIVVGASPAWLRYFSAKSAFTEYGNRLLRYDYAGGYKFASPEFEAATSFKDYAAQQKMLVDALGPLNSIYVRHILIEGSGSPFEWTATVESNFVYTKGNKMFVYELREIEGAWKLWAYKSY